MHLLFGQDSGQPFGFLGAQSVHEPQVLFQHLTVEEERGAEGLILGGTSDIVDFPGIAEPRLAAEWQNQMQLLAEGTRLGIPITFATDPRHAFSNNPAVSERGGKFSKWPEPVGLAATNDPELVETFADIARQEYLALGIRVAIHPMADLATEPRWSRINGTFGEDAENAPPQEADTIGFGVDVHKVKGYSGRQRVMQTVSQSWRHTMFRRKPL